MKSGFKSLIFFQLGYFIENNNSIYFCLHLIWPYLLFPRLAFTDAIKFWPAFRSIRKKLNKMKTICKYYYSRETWKSKTFFWVRIGTKLGDIMMMESISVEEKKKLWVHLSFQFIWVVILLVRSKLRTYHIQEISILWVNITKYLTFWNGLLLCLS